MKTEPLITLKVFAASGTVTEIDRISSLNVSLENGDLLGILPGHDKLIAATASETIRYRREGIDHEVAAQSGILMVERNVVSILTSG